jgi:isopenicillin N synthase-like dioxygenase
MRKLVLAIFISCFSTLVAFDATIPVLHLPDFYNEKTQADFLKNLEKAASEIGFFGLTGTGVETNLLDQSYEQIIAYFNRSLDEKMAMKTSNGQRGYAPGESAKGEKRVDFKEFFHVGRELSEEDLERLNYCKNVWPEDAPAFKSTMIDLFRAMDQCKEALGNAISAVLQQKSGYINEMIQEGECLMRAIHYPANPPANAIWAGAHTDIDFLTILPRSTAKGLQVLNKEGNWIDVIVPDGAFIINCGDMLENLTNGHFKSAVHRVIDPGNKEERYSVVFFVHPRSEDRLDPLPIFIEKTGGIRNYANVTRLELLAERLIDLGLASPSLMEFFVQSGAIEKLREVHRFSPKAEKALLDAGFVF